MESKLVNADQAHTVRSLEERVVDIAERRQALERRLDDGYLRIEEALRAGVDVSTWEDFWFQLLADYEGVCEHEREAA